MPQTVRRKIRPLLMVGAVVVAGAGTAFACTPWASDMVTDATTLTSRNVRLQPGAPVTTGTTPTAGATTPGTWHRHGPRRPPTRPTTSAPTTSVPTTSPARPGEPSTRPTTPTTSPSSPAAEPTQVPTTPAAGATTGGGTQTEQFQAQVLALTNAERAKAGCTVDLKMDTVLTKVAQAHAEDMLKNNYFSHDSQDGTGPFDRMTAAGYRWSRAAENIAAGQRTPQAVMTSWMNSSGHKANILNCGLTELGVGYAAGSGADYGQYWVQDFGTPAR